MSKSEWGNAVWILFHTLGSKINEEYLLENKERFNNFYSKCLFKFTMSILY